MLVLGLRSLTPGLLPLLSVGLNLKLAKLGLVKDGLLSVSFLFTHSCCFQCICTHTHMFIHVRQLDACLYVPGVPPQCIPSALFQSITVLMPSLTLAASVYTWALVGLGQA